MINKKNKDGMEETRLMNVCFRCCELLQYGALPNGTNSTYMMHMHSYLASIIISATESIV